MVNQSECVGGLTIFVHTAKGKKMIDAWIHIVVWSVVLIMLIISLMNIESRIAEDIIQQLFEYFKEREMGEITGKAGEKEKTEYEE